MLTFSLCLTRGSNVYSNLKSRSRLAPLKMLPFGVLQIISEPKEDSLLSSASTNVVPPSRNVQSSPISFKSKGYGLVANISDYFALKSTSRSMRLNGLEPIYGPFAPVGETKGQESVCSGYRLFGIRSIIVMVNENEGSRSQSCHEPPPPPSISSRAVGSPRNL
jgi:hypothetical protein